MTGGTRDPKSKRQVFVELLAEDWTNLHIDARRPGVRVPAHLGGQVHLILQYGYDLPIPIPDLYVDEAGVRATLSFSRTPNETFVPWSAVFGISAVDGRGVLYTEDVPREVGLVKVVADAGEALAPASEAHAPRRLQAVPGADGPADAAPLVGAARSRPQLRLVK